MARTLTFWNSKAVRFPLAVSVTALLVVTLAAFGGRSASAQDEPKPKKDAALEDLLKEINSKESKDATAKPSADQPAGKDSAGAKASSKHKEKEKDKPTAQEKSKTPPKSGSDGSTKPPSDVAPKDKALDNLLEKLGEAEDKPSRDERSRGGAPTPDEKEKEPGKGQDKDQNKERQPAGKNAKPEVDPLTGKAKDLDEHLEELTGKRRKKKGDGEDGSGPMSDVVKQMRDVEQRLGKEDTGEETRKKQQQIVKNLEQLIEQMRSSSSQSQGRPRTVAMKPGQKPGDKPGQTPGTTGGNAPMTKPQKPTDRRSLAGGKDAWGHLPPELRQEMDNVSNEDYLPARQDLIERYYNALAKKAVKRGESQP